MTRMSRARELPTGEALEQLSYDVQGQIPKFLDPPR